MFKFDPNHSLLIGASSISAHGVYLPSSHLSATKSIFESYLDAEQVNPTGMQGKNGCRQGNLHIFRGGGAGFPSEVSGKGIAYTIYR